MENSNSNSNNNNNPNDHGAAAGFAEPLSGSAARTVSPAVACLPQPQWSTDPTVNAMVALLLQKGLNPRQEQDLTMNSTARTSAGTNHHDQASSNNHILPKLLETLKERLKQEQRALAMSSDDRTQSRSNTTHQNLIRHAHDPQVAQPDSHALGQVPSVSGNDSQSSPDGSPSHADACSGSKTNNNSSDNNSSDNNNGKPTRRELLEALQQHMDILEQRGQVSSVIPGFLKRPRDAQPKRKREQGKQDHNNEQDQLSTSSTKAVQTGRKRLKQCTSKFQYYEDLATELLSNVVIPVPQVVYVPTGSQLHDDSMDTLTEADATEFTGDSTDLESFCSTASSGRKPSHQRPSSGNI